MGPESLYLLPWSYCRQETYLVLQDDGSWFFPYRNETIDEVKVFGEYTADCRPDGLAMAGGNPNAKSESIRECQNLLKQIFQLH